MRKYPRRQNGQEKPCSVVAAIGLMAGFCTITSFVAQVVKTWRTRSTQDISLGMFLIYVTGNLLWLLYGVLLQDLPLILANAARILLAGSILTSSCAMTDHDGKLLPRACTWRDALLRLPAFFASRLE